MRTISPLASSEAPPRLAQPRRAALLDRDGVLNPSAFRDGRPRAPLALEDFVPYPWARVAVATLRRAGLVCLVVTNQPDVAAGTLGPQVLDAMHERLVREVGVDAIYVCPHGQADRCDCRKPRPGLLRRAAADWNVDLLASFMVGDRASDVEAGRAAGCVTLLVDGPENGAAEPHYRAATLLGAADLILTLTRDANETFRRLCQPVRA